jgi:hypothetical protein
MTSDIEELIREAQARQAERAVDPDRIRAALPVRPIRPVRYRRYGGIATLAAAGVAAIMVLAPSLLRPGGGSGAAQQPNTTASTTTASTPTPRPTAGTLTDTVAHLRRTVDDGRADGGIRPDVAQNLLKAIDRLDQAATAGRVADVRYTVDNLRHMVDIGAREGAVSAGATASLHANLDRVKAAA